MARRLLFPTQEDIGQALRIPVLGRADPAAGSFAPGSATFADNSAQHFENPYVAALAPLTLMCWYYSGGEGGSKNIAGLMDSTDWKFLRLSSVWTGSTTAFQCEAINNSVESSLTVNTNTWYHLTGVLHTATNSASDKAELYVNAGDRDYQTNSAARDPSTRFVLGLWIGRGQQSGAFPLNSAMSICHVAAWQGILPHAAIRAIYSGEVAPSDVMSNALIGYWPMTPNWGGRALAGSHRSRLLVPDTEFGTVAWVPSARTPPTPPRILTQRGFYFPLALPAPTAAPVPPTIDALYAHVVNRTTGEIYFTKADTTNADNASITKLMSVYVLLKHYPTRALLESVDVTIQASDLVGGTGANLQVGDVWTLYTLLQDMLLPSSNDATQAMSRVIGQKIIDEGGPGSSSDPEDRFVEVMNVYASELAMTATTYTTAHGNETSHVVTAADVSKILVAVARYPVVREVSRWRIQRITITRGSPTVLTITHTVDVIAELGFRWGKSGSVGGDFHLATVTEFENGQDVCIVTLHGTSDAARYQDYRDICAWLRTNYAATLGTNVTPWTPGIMFSRLRADGGGWDASVAGNTYQDDGQLTPAVAGDPVRRWYAEWTGAGTPDVYFFCDADAKRPVLQSDGSLLSDGSDDYLELSTGGSLGATYLYAENDPGQSDYEPRGWMVAIRYLIVGGDDGTIIAKAGATQGNRTFQVFNDGPSNPGYYVRGNNVFTNAGIDDGNVHGWAGSFDPQHNEAMGDHSTGPIDRVIGTAARETSEVITLFSRSGGTGFILEGRIYRVVICDRYDPDHLYRLRDWVRGGTPNAYADTPPEAPPLFRRRAVRMFHLTR